MRTLLLVLLLASTFNARAEALRPFDATSWAKIRQTHIGRPTLVHFWGMTCGPCRTEMPKLGAFVAKHPDIDVVTIDTDAIASTADAAKSFLKGSEMPLGEAWQFAEPFAEKLYFSVDPAWQGEIPMTMLVGRNGSVVQEIGAVDTDRIEQWLAAQNRTH